MRRAAFSLAASPLGKIPLTSHGGSVALNVRRAQGYRQLRRLAVRRMSLSPLSASKRRRSMDPSILKTTSESEEDQTVDRKVSAPLDPSTLHILERCGDTRNEHNKIYKQK